MIPFAPKRRRAVWEPVALVAKVLRECQLIHLALMNILRGAAPTPGHAMGTGTGKAPRKATGGSDSQEPLESNAFDGSSGEDRTIGLRDHGKDHGFPRSIVPAMEENVVVKSLDSFPKDSATCGDSRGEKEVPDMTPEPQGRDGRKSQGHGIFAVSRDQDVKANDDMEVSKTKPNQGGVKTLRSFKPFRDLAAPPATLEVGVEGGELKGAPADPSRIPKTDDQPPHTVFGENDAARTEGEAVYARAEIREHPSTKFNPNTWTLQTPTPTVDPRGFEDPISDEFWKKVWMACAVHNVSECARRSLMIAEIPSRQ